MLYCDDEDVVCTWRLTTLTLPVSCGSDTYYLVPAANRRKTIVKYHETIQEIIAQKDHLKLCPWDKTKFLLILWNVTSMLIWILLLYYDICSKYHTLLCTGCGECGVSSGEKCHYISYYVRPWPSLDTRAGNEPSQSFHNQRDSLYYIHGSPPAPWLKVPTSPLGTGSL